MRRNQLTASGQPILPTFGQTKDDGRPLPLYLAVVLDLFSRKIAGWRSAARSMDSSMKRGLVIKALQMAMQARGPAKGLLHHRPATRSDRGSQYASQDYQQLLSKAGIIGSMSRKGNCYDNAPTESFFASLKRELIYHRYYQSRTQAGLPKPGKIFSVISSFGIIEKDGIPH